VTNAAKAHMAPTDPYSGKAGTEKGWEFYAKRPFLAGLCYWTGFDYRGEPSPYGWPQVNSQEGLIDLCGFPKDSYYYLKSWWQDKPVLHVFPPWDHPGKEGKPVDVTVYSNCHQVELFLNHKSLGRKTMLKNSHLEWNVNYEPGTLTARGYNKNGKEIMTTTLQTPGKPVAVKLTANRSNIKADGQDVSVIRVQVNDAKGQMVPNADNKITFNISGPGKIIGVGNGNPSSHEKEQFVETDKQLVIKNLKAILVKEKEGYQETLFHVNDSGWKGILNNKDEYDIKANDSLKTCVIRGEFDLPEYSENTEITLWPKILCQEEESIYVNGHLIAEHLKRGDPDHSYKLSHSILRRGKNVYAVVGTPLKPRYKYDVLNTNPGIVQVKTPAGVWTRNAFNGLAQVIVQSTKKPGTIVLTATSKGLSTGKIIIHTKKVPLQPTVPAMKE
jgi:beta-galactosidase